jgi:hypothetical protein
MAVYFANENIDSMGRLGDDRWIRVVSGNIYHLPNNEENALVWEEILAKFTSDAYVTHIREDCMNRNPGLTEEHPTPEEQPTS